LEKRKTEHENKQSAIGTQQSAQRHQLIAGGAEKYKSVRLKIRG
jgi:hypothetical protein